jgi:DDE superfamily endonuclease
VARPIYEKLRTRTPDGYYLVTDTAFPRGTDQIQGRIKAPIKNGSRLPADPVERKRMLAFDRQLLSYRQTAEWGNRTLQGCFGRLRIPLEVNYNDRRGDLLETCVRLYNLRTRRVGLNQIRSVYMPIWTADEQEEIWGHFEDLLFSTQRKNDRVRRFHMDA